MTPASAATAASRAFATGTAMIAVVVLSYLARWAVGANETTFHLSVIAIVSTQMVLAAQFAADERDHTYRQRVDHELLRAVPDADERIAEDV